MKFSHDALLKADIQAAPTPREAFIIAQKYKTKMRTDWHTVNLQIMKQAIWTKSAQHYRLRMQLISTGAIVLIEDAGVNDTFYGAGADYKGHNYLGRILMLIRTHIQKALLGFAAKDIVAKQHANGVSPQKRTWLQRFSQWVSSWFLVPARRG